MPASELEGARKEHLDRGEWYDAALITQRLARPAEAAELFERATRLAEAACCWSEAGDHARAIAAAVQVPRRHALHRACASLAFRSALALGRREPKLDRWADALQRAGFSETSTDLELHAELAAYQKLTQTLVAPPPHHDVLRQFAENQSAAEPHKGPPLPTVGDLFAARYRLDSLLGTGASSAVFLARDEAVGERVALKIITGSLGDEALARIAREIELARKLTHESIVRVFDLVVSDGLYGLSMEAVEGTTLSRLIARGRLPIATARDYLLQAAAALGFAHERGVVHRDVKPGNMLLSAQGSLKITDFGIAKAHQESSITRTGSVLGMPYYIAPEQIFDAKQVDHRADVYALGVVAYQLFTGRVPFDGETVLEILGKHVNTAAQSPRLLAPELPVELEWLLLDMLAKNPTQRVQSCTLVAERLARLCLR